MGGGGGAQGSESMVRGRAGEEGVQVVETKKHAATFQVRKFGGGSVQISWVRRCKGNTVVEQLH